MSKVYTIGHVEEMLSSPKILPPLTDDIEIVVEIACATLDAHPALMRLLWDEEMVIYERWESEYLRRQNTRLRREKALLWAELQAACQQHPKGYGFSLSHAARILQLTEDK